jgi:hypothetical protein
MDDYLSKPIELRQLRLLMARWLADHAPELQGDTPQIAKVA